MRSRFHHLFFLHPRLYGCAYRWYGIWPELQAGPWCRFQLETCKQPCFRRETTSFSPSLVSLMSTCNSFMWMKMSLCAWNTFMTHTLFQVVKYWSQYRLTVWILNVLCIVKTREPVKRSLQLSGLVHVFHAVHYLMQMNGNCQNKLILGLCFFFFFKCINHKLPIYGGRKGEMKFKSHPTSAPKTTTNERKVTPLKGKVQCGCNFRCK